MERLREWRLRRFLTQKALAELVGVPYQTVQRWESGQVFPRPTSLRKLCEALGATPDELLTLAELQGKKAAA